jgi:parallel beta-helix repeat protein
MVTVRRFLTMVAALTLAAAAAAAGPSANASGLVPGTPTGLSATAKSATQVSLAWSASRRAKTYTVYRNGQLKKSGISTTSYLDGTASGGHTYAYTVTACNSAGCSAQSAPASVTTPPTVPTGLSAKADSTMQVTVSWNASPGATTYSLYRNGSLFHAGITTTSYVDGTVIASTTYQYSVSACDAGGCSPLSTSVSVTTPASSGSCAGIPIAPGTDIQSSIDAQPEGTTFCFASGTYVLAKPILPKSSDTFAADGTVLLTGSDTGDAAFDGYSVSATNVTIDGFTVEHFTTSGSGGPDAAISLSSGSHVENNEVRYNGQRGVRVLSGTTVRDNYIHDNGRLGLVGGGRDITVVGNELAYNDMLGYGRGAGGATKFSKTTNLVLRSNYVHDNTQSGLYCDGGCVNTTFDSNTITNNSGSGIHYEISYGGVIENNTVTNNSAESTGLSLWWGANIFLLSSSGVEIYGNTVTADNGANAIGLRDSDRGFGSLGVYEINNDYVHDNVIEMVPGSETGMVGTRPEKFTLQNARFQHNTYKVTDVAASFWQWQGSLTWTGWKAVGQDTTGTVEPV